VDNPRPATRRAYLVFYLQLISIIILWASAPKGAKPSHLITSIYVHSVRTSVPPPDFLPYRRADEMNVHMWWDEKTSPPSGSIFISILLSPLLLRWGIGNRWPLMLLRLVNIVRLIMDLTLEDRKPVGPYGRGGGLPAQRVGHGGPGWNFRGGKFHDMGDAKWIVIRRSLRGNNDTPFERSTRPLGVHSGSSRLQGVIGVFLVT
jgi:hypothetical protein